MEAKASRRVADRRGMRHDLLLALASIVVVLSPCLVDAWMNHEFRMNHEFQKEGKTQSYTWSSRFLS
jgi:hypothetical protein